uniref:Uncharacterized protein n=1 Tax=Phytophthora ramorum TaxID=164328 RepID=H3H4F6_PHYRM
MTGAAVLVIKTMAACSGAVMICSPALLIYQVFKKQDVGVASVIPLVTLFANCHVWAVYGYMIENWFPIFWIYLFGDVYTRYQSQQLREVLLVHWEAAGLRLASYEEAIFALTLPALPTGLLRVAGKIVASIADDQMAALGDAVDRIIASCWSIGTELYLLAVWRWRVAHFDALNVVTTAYHTAGLRTRLHYGHLDATRDQAANFPPQIGDRLSAAIQTTTEKYASTDQYPP